MTDSLFVPALQPAAKHATVFRKFDSLAPGESFLLINDHDPIPLFYEMKAERGEIFEWNRIENGPEIWKVEIRKTADPAVARQEMPGEGAGSKEDYVLNVTLIEPRMKHPTIFRYFDEMVPGEQFQILNDHDPKPLYYQLIAERGNIFSWNYLEKGPKWWRVQIRKNNPESGETIGQIAAKDMRKAEVFRKYGIDFCCGGKKSLRQACEEKGLDPAAVEAELDHAPQTLPAQENFDRWNPDFLADYIYNKHHLYYYEEAPVLEELIAKVTERHGEAYPGLQKLASLYNTLAEELKAHFMKEERILFPFIKALVKAKQAGSTEELLQNFSVAQPIRMMESDHDAAGGILEEISAVTNQYTPPAGACNSFQFLYSKLKALQDDLHQHIHLENNILFPKALALEKEVFA